VLGNRDTIAGDYDGQQNSAERSETPRVRKPLFALRGSQSLLFLLSLPRCRNLILRNGRPFPRGVATGWDLGLPERTTSILEHICFGGSSTWKRLHYHRKAFEAMAARKSVTALMNRPLIGRRLSFPP